MLRKRRVRKFVLTFFHIIQHFRLIGVIKIVIFKNVVAQGGLNKGRKMAKKNTPAALQTDVSTDEEWTKILDRKGLIGKERYTLTVNFFFLFVFSSFQL